MKRSFSLLLAALALGAFLLPSAEAMATPMFNRDDTEEGAERNCKLLGPFALFIQAIMGVVVVGSLVLKRQREKPKRPWKIWYVEDGVLEQPDISKQATRYLETDAGAALRSHPQRCTVMARKHRKCWRRQSL